jgi:hypothetical protein
MKSNDRNIFSNESNKNRSMSPVTRKYCVINCEKSEV